MAGETGLVVKAICDRNPQRLHEARTYLEAEFAEHGTAAQIREYAVHDDLIRDPNVDLILVTTPSYAHRETTLPALDSGKKVYLDKPIAQNLEDSRAILAAEEAAGHPLIMGFTRRYESPWRKAFSLVRDGLIGPLHMLQLRAVIPYDVYFHTWHRRREWSGGALNDKSSHHFDVLNWFADSRAAHLSAIGGRRVYLPEADAPPRCRECDRECPYRRETSWRPQAGKGVETSWDLETDVVHRDDNCVYLPGADIKDHALVQVGYENGIVASLFWCIFGPRADDQETLELVGSKGRIRLNRHDATLDVVTDYGDTTRLIDCRTPETASSHFGADKALIRDLRVFYDGMSPEVSAREGYEATRMVMASHLSIDEGGRLVPMSELSATSGPSLTGP